MMVLEFLSQHPQPLDVAAATAKGGGHNHRIGAAVATPTTFHHLQALKSKREIGITDLERRRTMSPRNGAKLELKLNLSPPRARGADDSPRRSPTVSPTSSCVSSEVNQQDEQLRYSTSPEATSMMLVGCPRCLMYVMLAGEDPRCPKCKSSVLLDIIHDTAATTAKTNKR